MLANELITGISEDDFFRACHELMVNTEYLEIYVEDYQEEIKKTNFAIEIISDYLKTIADKKGVTGKQLRKKFRRKFAKIIVIAQVAGRANLISVCITINYSIQVKLNVLLEDINYNVKVETLKRHKFVKFSAKSSFRGSIKDGIQSPKDAKEIFMGGGIIGSDVVKMGVFGTTDELFDQREYPRNQDTAAKSVRKYYAYYDSGELEPIGFSKRQTIKLHDPDVSYPDDETKLSAYTAESASLIDTFGNCTLWRCGSLTEENQTDFDDTFQIVFYYRT